MSIMSSKQGVEENRGSHWDFEFIACAGGLLVKQVYPDLDLNDCNTGKELHSLFGLG